ncbi:hypothetical protein PR048_012194 [Dryococelus australis]|uniref:Uncharacterized protein n=1 Tax=Dryococelus australis TaxID=614101 RepID=A0ABQ9HNP6_9NEOP|nr:hypothetical protein PR048_012194 [Dryococelus australis]
MWITPELPAREKVEKTRRQRYNLKAASNFLHPAPFQRDLPASDFAFRALYEYEYSQWRNDAGCSARSTVKFSLMPNNKANFACPYSASPGYNQSGLPLTARSFFERRNLFRPRGPRWLSGYPARLTPTRSGLNPQPGHSGFSHVGIVPDDAVGRRVFSGISRFPALSFRLCSILTSISLIGSQDLDVKSRPNLFTSSDIVQHTELEHYIGSPLVDDWPIMNAVKYTVVPGVVWINRTMVRSNTDTNRTGVLALVNKAISLLSFHHSELGSILGWDTGLSQVGIVRTMPLAGGYSRGSPVSTALSFRCCSILTSTTLIGSQCLAVKSRPNLAFVPCLKIFFLFVHRFNGNTFSGFFNKLGILNTLQRKSIVTWAEPLTHSAPVDIVVYITHGKVIFDLYFTLRNAMTKDISVDVQYRSNLFLIGPVNIIEPSDEDTPPITPRKLQKCELDIEN